MIPEFSTKYGKNYDEIRQISFQLIEAEKRCSKEYKKSVMISDCIQAKYGDISSISQLSFEELSEIKHLSVQYRWELKEFFIRHPGSSLSILKEIFSMAMEKAFACESSSREDSERDCMELAAYSVCKDHGYDKESCSQIISMGIDYQWSNPAMKLDVNKNYRYRNQH